jgi:hypothetical protein
MRRVLGWECLAWCVVLCGLSGPAVGGGPLRERIDRAVEAALDGPAAPPATDGEFLRRASLDLTGRIPTAAEARTFLDDPSPYKRERLVDRLLAAPEYARRMQEVFDVMLLERRDEKHVPAADWREYLRRSFAANKPYDALAREILSADGVDPGSRPAAKFALDREAEPNLLTRDIGRVFLGRDLQCAQCHDHPLIDDYKQAHYYGLLAFVGRTVLFDDPARGKVLGEKADGDVTFASVFKKGLTHKTGPRVLDGPAMPDPVPAKGQEYVVPPGGKARPVPVFSRRDRLAPALTSGGVAAFDRNAANRLWALLMGRGLVHPLDMDHGENPPSHPALLDDLARSFRASGYDVKAFLREVALTRAYQRSSEPPPGAGASAEDPAKFAVAALKPLSPEQLGWSVMQALGVLADYRDEAVDRVDRDPRLRAILQTDARRRALREELIEARVYEQLAPSLGPFIGRFGGAPGQPQDRGGASVQQALFLSNGEPIQGWLDRGGHGLARRLAALADPAAVADELYLSVLTRRPVDDERAEVARYLTPRRDDRVAALKELVWSLLTSAEFRFNH